MIVFPIRAFIKVFYKIPLKHNFFECVDYDDLIAAKSKIKNEDYVKQIEIN